MDDVVHSASTRNVQTSPLPIAGGAACRRHSIWNRLRAASRLVLACLVLAGLESMVLAQAVCLPAPRLLTTMPMGGRVGTEFEVTITGEHLEGLGELTFSDSRITAIPKLEAGLPVPNKYVVTIADDCPPGLYEARVMTLLGVSSSRIFAVGTLPEVVQQSNTSLGSALELEMNSVCNAVMTPRAVDHYVFEAKRGQRVVVDCATKGIDSKLDAVVIITDAAVRDLLVERRGGALDFTVPEDGRYVIKVHELTFQGGPAFYYRLVLRELPPGAPLVRHPSTQPVNAFSWPPTGLPEQPETVEIEPNNEHAQAQKISLPCDIAGSFYPAADVDRFEFEAKKGEVWWVEVASQRFGLPTNPMAVVHRVERTAEGETLTEVAEFSEIPSPIKISSFGYAYDGPPYDAGTSDVLGKLEIPADGVYRLQLSDLYGGTRDDPANVYRLVIREPAPDFALVAWALHMQLRNGDRNALSKPISLRGGATMALEVVALRRDGFDGDIELFMDGLPEGVTAQGLTIPAGQSRGIMLVTADDNAPRSFALAKFYGRAEVGGTVVDRPCRLASMAWPIPNHWSEIPHPRLLADVPVSVSGSDYAPITIAPAEGTVFEATTGEKLTIPLALTPRSEFSGATAKLKALGAGFEGMPAFDLPLAADSSEAVLDLAALKTPPGDYTLAFFGSAVVKYRHMPALVEAAEVAHRQAAEEVKKLEAEAQRLADETQGATEAATPEIEQARAELAERQKAAAARLTAADNQLKKATEAARPKDIADIIVSQPIKIRVKPAEQE
jgi:hypothetical protein